MIGVLGRRLLQSIPVVLIGSVLVWGMLLVVPGDPAAIRAGINATPAQVDAQREALGLDQSIFVQYWKWLGGVLQGDLGKSLISGSDVGETVWLRIPATIQLALFAMALIVVISVPLGIYAGAASSRSDRALFARLVNIYTSVAIAVPVFWTGIILILALSVGRGWFPSVSPYVSVFEDPVSFLHASFLPAITIALFASGVLTRIIASTVREEMGKDYIQVVRAKGVSGRRVLFDHALRNAALPILTLAGLQMGALLGGAVVVESVFTYPGVGRLVVSAISQLDYPVVQIVVLLAIAAFLLVNLIVDVLHGVLDPRIRR